jgi:hypothetical protein
MTTPKQTPAPSPSTGLDSQKLRSDLENLLKQAVPAQKQGDATADKPATK